MVTVASLSKDLRRGTVFLLKCAMVDTFTNKLKTLLFYARSAYAASCDFGATEIA